MTNTQTESTEQQPEAEAAAQAETPIAAEAVSEAAAPAPAQEGAPGADMASAMAYEDSFKKIAPGEFLSGVVVRVDADGVLVDVGYKTEGKIPVGQLSHRNLPPEEVVKVGETIDVVVQRVEDSEGVLILSKKRADLESAWLRVLKAQETGQTLTATCTEQVKGGLIVDLGLRGFVPASHVDLRPVHDLSDYVGEVLELKVVEVDKARRKVVLSRKNALMEERSKMKERTMGDLDEGQIVSGAVARLTNFGAFINLGGVDGLVHISELAWKRIKHPSEVVRVGEKVDVRILSINKSKERISLSLKQARPDPWMTITENFKEGSIVPGKVSKLVKNYVFVEIADGVEGLIPISELADFRVGKPQDILKPEQEVKVKVLDVNPDTRRITLSLRQANPGVAMPAEYRDRGGDSSTGFTLGERLPDALKAQLLGQSAAQEEKPKPAPRSESAPEPAPAPLAEVIEVPIIETTVCVAPEAQATEPEASTAAPAEEPASEAPAEEKS
ncbi:30S ribosomal protein S1 [bacterium CPR1]|nr:30S ribosomal protein S1 [bacterium CPR1]